MGKGGARPNSGRKRKSLDLKKLSGTARKDRDGAGDPPAVPGSLICPNHLGDLEQLHFGTIAGYLEQQGRASPHYSEHVALTAMRLSQIQRYKAVLEVEGDTFECKTGTGGVMIRKRPEVQMLSDAMRHAQSLLAELGLNPAAAARFGAGEEEEASGFADFFKG